MTGAIEFKALGRKFSYINEPHSLRITITKDRKPHKWNMRHVGHIYRERKALMTAEMRCAARRASFNFRQVFTRDFWWRNTA
jgi:hypothetical protein